MHMLRIEHPVASYEGWKRAFDSDPVGREKSPACAAIVSCASLTIPTTS
jgi:hypothetical protein